MNRGITEVFANRACLFAAGCFLAQLEISVYAGHNAQDVIIYCVHTHLGRGGTRDRRGREHKLEHGVINTGEIARATWLVLLGAESEGVHVNARIGSAGVVLEGLDHVEVGTLTLREAVLAVKLELGSDARILTPTMHVKGGLGKHEGAGIGETRTGLDTSLGSIEESGVSDTGRRPGSVTLGSGGGNVNRTGHLEETVGGNDTVGTIRLTRTTKCVDGIGKSVQSIRVVEGLGTKSTVESLGGIEGRAVVDVGIRLDNPDELLARVVEVQLDLIRGRAHRLIAGKLELLEEVLMGVLCHLAALVGIQEDIVDVEGGRNQGLLVGSRDGENTGGGREGRHCPQALTNGAEIKVDLHLVVLKSDQRERKTRVAIPPEKEGNVERGLRECVTGSAHLGRATGRRAGAVHGGEGRVGDVGKLGSVTNHLEVTALLLTSERKLVPDVHPVTVLAVNALTTNLDLNLSDELLTDEIHPAGIDTSVTGSHGLVDLRESHLKVRAVAQITVTGDRASDTATEIGLTREGLLDGFHREVCVASVRHLPESDLRSSREENVLSTVSYQLHKSSTHILYYTIAKENNF